MYQGEWKMSKDKKCKHKWEIAQQDFTTEPALYQYLCIKCPARKYTFINSNGVVNEQVVMRIKKGRR